MLTLLLLAPTALPCEAAPQAMACVPGGDFLRGTDGRPKDARPKATVWVQTFYMDVDEVRTGDYQACVKAKKCTPAKALYADFSHPDQPMNGGSWHDAVKYCKAQGKHLPTEAEWEKAARGTDGRTYPWGEARATCKLAVIKDARGRGCGRKKRFGKHPEKGRTWPVGKKPAAMYGLRDMAGNSYEWVADWYSPSYAECGKDCVGPDPKGPCRGADTCPGHRQRVVRGGSWYWGWEHARSFYRRAHVPSNKPAHHFGFRCASSADEARALR